MCKLAWPPPCHQRFRMARFVSVYMWHMRGRTDKCFVGDDDDRPRLQQSCVRRASSVHPHCSVGCGQLGWALYCKPYLTSTVLVLFHNVSIVPYYSMQIGWQRRASFYRCRVATVTAYAWPFEVALCRCRKLPGSRDCCMHARARAHSRVLLVGLGWARGRACGARPINRWRTVYPAVPFSLLGGRPQCLHSHATLGLGSLAVLLVLQRCTRLVNKRTGGTSCAWHACMHVCMYMLCRTEARPAARRS